MPALSTGDRPRPFPGPGVRAYTRAHAPGPESESLVIYRLKDGAYGRPEVRPLVGETAVGAVAGLSITWP